MGGIKHTYTLDGAKILREQWVEGEDIKREIVPLYDNEDNVCGILYGDIPYYFLKNLQGDVIAITNQRGETVARYTYDAWGACTISYDATATPADEDAVAINIATVNPFRYRSYYFDTETGLYYLQSRYYDPALGRFVNGDDAVYAIHGEAPTLHNLYGYCINNPVSTFDKAGTLPTWIKNAIQPLQGLISEALFRIVLDTPLVIGSSAVMSATVAKAIMNYMHNRKLEKQKPIIGYIKDQNDYGNWRLGFSNLAACGCELIAVYNAMKALNYPCTLASLALQFELSGYVMLFGYFGSSPTELWRCFALNKMVFGKTFSHKTVSAAATFSRCIIVSCWNGKITNGLHTFMVKYTDKKFRSYNGYSYSKKSYGDSLSDIMYTNQFIVGYWFV